MNRYIYIFALLIINACIHINSSHADSDEPWNLPVLPAHFKLFPKEDFNGKRIPRHLWMTFRHAPNSTAEVHANLAEVLNRQVKSNWTVHFWDDALMLHFLETEFANTSLLWAYKLIHPRLGVSRADIWRYAVIWYYGGVYMDDDSLIAVNFDEIITPEDRMIVSVEKNRMQDRCYISSYPNSVTNLMQAYEKQFNERKVDNHILINWLFMAEPGSPVLANALRIIVELISHEYFQMSLLQQVYSASRPKWMQVMCITGPSLLSTAALLTVLTHNNSDNRPFEMQEIITVKKHIDWRTYGGTYKNWDAVVPREQYYMFFMTREDIPMLDHYADPTFFLERHVITSNQRDYFYVFNNTRYAFENAQTMVQLGFNKENLLILPASYIRSMPADEKRIISLQDRKWIQKVQGIPFFKPVTPDMAIP